MNGSPGAEGLQSTKQDPVSVIKLCEGEWVTGAEGLQSTKKRPSEKNYLHCTSKRERNEPGGFQSTKQDPEIN